MKASQLRLKNVKRQRAPMQCFVMSVHANLQQLTLTARDRCGACIQRLLYEYRQFHICRVCVYFVRYGAKTFTCRT